MGVVTNIPRTRTIMHAHVYRASQSKMCAYMYMYVWRCLYTISVHVDVNNI